jgi:hypothetical protein
MQVNTGLKELRIIFSSWTCHHETLVDFKFEDSLNRNDEKLSAAMKVGLGRNLDAGVAGSFDHQMGDNDSSLWWEAFSFLRNSTALKTLYVDFEQNVTESHATAIRMEVPAALCENESLETLSVNSKDARGLSRICCCDPAKYNIDETPVACRGFFCGQ